MHTNYKQPIIDKIHRKHKKKFSYEIPFYVLNLSKKTITIDIKGGYKFWVKHGSTLVQDLISSINYICKTAKINYLIMYYNQEIVPTLYENLWVFDEIQCENIHLHYGDLNVHQNLPNYKFKNNVTFEPSEVFSKIYLHNLYKYPSLKKETQYKRDFNKKCEKKFCSVIGTIRMHRLYLANILYNHNYHRFGYTSCIPILVNRNKLLPCHAGVPYVPNINEIYKKLLHTFATADHNILNKEDTAGISKSPLSWFCNSYFNIVNESFFSDVSPNNELFITEKTYKPIFHTIPFIVNGCAGTLEYLHKRGFETFPEIFNEDYDKEPNAEKRMSLIIREIKRACNDPNLHEKVYSCQKKLIHNKNLLLDKYNTKF